MYARDRIAAIINAIGSPLIDLGVSANSSLSLIADIIINDLWHERGG